MVRRCVTLLLAAVLMVLGWLASTPTAVAAPQLPSAITATYDNHNTSSVLPSATSERGPPEATDRDIPYDAVGHRSHGAWARLNGPATPSITTFAYPGMSAVAVGPMTTTGREAVLAGRDLSSLQRLHVAAKGASGLSDDVIGLATRNVTNSGDTVLGHFPGYITKANSKGASYFDIGDAWNGLTPTQRWAANTHFLDTRIAAGDRVLLSVPKGDIRPGSYLAQEVQYLTSNGYRWTNQWSLIPRG